MIRITDPHRDAIKAMLDPGEPLVAVTSVTRGTDVGTVGRGAANTVFDVAEYLREDDIVARRMNEHAANMLATIEGYKQLAESASHDG